MTKEEPSISRQFLPQASSHSFVGWLYIVISCAFILPTTKAWTIQTGNNHPRVANTELRSWSLFPSDGATAAFSSPWYNEHNPTARAFVDYYDPAPTTSYSFVTVADDWPMATTIPNQVSRRNRGNPLRRALRRRTLLKQIRRKA